MPSQWSIMLKKPYTSKVNTGDGTPQDGTKQRGRTRCIFCNNTINDAQLREQSQRHGTGLIPLATVAEGKSGRVYLASPVVELWQPETPDLPWLNHRLPDNARWFSPPGYGLNTFKDLFTNRQLIALSTFCSLVSEARETVTRDGGSTEYADALATYLAFGVDRIAMFMSTLCVWSSAAKNEILMNTFARQALPMTWDFGEANVFGNSSGSFEEAILWVARVCEGLPARGLAWARNLDATASSNSLSRAVVVTDPPYYDNIGYADLSDYFYIWLRHSLKDVYPDLFSTILVPKSQELIADPYRFDGSKARAQDFFETGLRKAFATIHEMQDPLFPFTLFYAFKQSESGDEVEVTDAITSTGWETMLEGLIGSGFQVVGTWPMRTERPSGVKVSVNALASSIVLVCRPRPNSASITTRKDFLSVLKKELPRALRDMQKGNIAPVDLAQAAIGPGMAVFSRYKKVLETDGSPMRVRTALALINQGLDEVLSELESEFDPDTRWALAWFEQHQFDEGAFGEAEVLATAKALSISHLAEAGLLHSRAGKVRLLRREELPKDWDPSTVGRLTVWEVTQHLIRSLDQKGEKETANLKAKIGGMAEIARDLAYRLYTLCERKGWAEEAGYYNSLVVAWPSMASEAFELR